MLSNVFRKTFLPFTTWLNWLIEIKFPEIHCNHPTKFTEVTNLLKSHDLSTSLDQGGLHNFIFFFLQLGNSWISILWNTTYSIQVMYTTKVSQVICLATILERLFCHSQLGWIGWLKLNFRKFIAITQLNLQKWLTHT